MTKKSKNLILDEIVSIEEVGFIQTYDFTVPPNNCFVANNVLVHNSGELEESADALLHCEWVYKENPDHGDKREYHNDVKKQRHGPCDYTTINFDADTYSFSSRF